MLDQETFTGLDISSEIEVLNYISTSEESIITIARIDLDDIVGSGNYACQIYLNGNEIVPNYDIPVGSTNQAIFQTRQLLLVENDVLSITVTGRVSDTAVNVVSRLVDVTPISAEDLSTSIVDDIKDNLIEAVVAAIGDVTVQVQAPVQRSLLGPCQRPVRTFTLPG